MNRKEERKERGKGE